MRVSQLLTYLLLSSTTTLACGGARAVRGEDVEGLDTDAMGTGLDKRDLQKLKSENMNALDSAAVVRRWESENMPQLSVLPFRNETSEHIDSALDALLSDIETDLINAGHVAVISLENQASMMAEIKRQQGEGFDQGKAAAFGKQLGVKYIITGKVFSTDEKMNKERRVQYYLFMQVLEVETGQILFQNKASLTKAML
jgi:TolB-like protein